MTTPNPALSATDQLIACVEDLSSELANLKASLQQGDRNAARAKRDVFELRLRAFVGLLEHVANQAHLDPGDAGASPSSSGELVGAALLQSAAVRNYSPQKMFAGLQTVLSHLVAGASTVVSPAKDDPRAASQQSTSAPTTGRIPNASVSRPIDHDLARWLELHASAGIACESLPPGLEVDDRMHLVGIPVSAGEYRIRWTDRTQTKQGEILLTVNADPRSLWQNLPSDASAPFSKPDSDSASRPSPVARVVVASVRGRSHAHVGSFREDDFSLHVPDAGDAHGWHILCVADGAGSAKMSRRGSQLAAETMVARLRDLLAAGGDQHVSASIHAEGALQAATRELNARSLDADESDKSDAPFWTPRLYQVLATAANHAQAAVRAEADANNAAIRDYATTLLATIIRKTRKGAWFVGSYWVGDGAIGMWKADWQLPKLFGEPDSGEYAGQTTFFTSEDFGRSDLIVKRLGYTVVDSFDLLALMTDGISDPKFPTEHLLKQAQPWREFEADLSAVLADLRTGQGDPASRLVEWMDFWSAGNHDDRTLLLLIPYAS